MCFPGLSTPWASASTMTGSDSYRSYRRASRLALFSLGEGHGFDLAEAEGPQTPARSSIAGPTSVGMVSSRSRALLEGWVLSVSRHEASRMLRCSLGQ